LFEEAHARACRAPELTVSCRVEAKPGERALELEHVCPARTSAQTADPQPTPVAGATTLRSLEGLKEPLRDACRAIKACLCAERPHHRRSARPKLPVRPQRVAEGSKHTLELPHLRTSLAQVQAL
jgi:hypothetical protein